jgi:phosphatidylglycerophosphate synthase
MPGRWVSLAEIARTVPRGAASSDSVWTRLVLRPLSIPVTAALLPLGVSANAVTWFGIGVCLAAAGLMALGGRPEAIAGAALFNLFAVLDCVDGNVARVRGGSLYGPWVDALGGYVAYTAVLLAAGSAAGEPLAGGIAAACNLLMRVAHQSFRNIEPGRAAASPERASLEKRVSENLGITGLLAPAVLAGAIAGALRWVVLPYAAFYAAACAAVLLRLAVKAGRGGPAGADPGGPPSV